MLSLSVLLLLASTASALPRPASRRAELDPRIVGTISCSPYNFTTPSPSLYINSTTLGEETNSTNSNIEVGFFAGAEADQGLSAFASANPRRNEGVFGFEVCESGMMKSKSNTTSSFGHATYTASNGSVFCLTVTYPYKGQEVKLEECSISDDSSQFLQWWHLSNTTASPAPVLEFAGPVIVPNNPPLSPASTGSRPFAPVTLARQNDTDAFLFFGPSSTVSEGDDAAGQKGVALEKEPEKKSAAQ